MTVTKEQIFNSAIQYLKDNTQRTIRGFNRFKEGNTDVLWYGLQRNFGVVEFVESLITAEQFSEVVAAHIAHTEEFYEAMAGKEQL